jgi:hypothetical protein
MKKKSGQEIAIVTESVNGGVEKSTKENGSGVTGNEKGRESGTDG